MHVRVDFAQTWIDGAVVLSKFQNETSLTLVDWVSLETLDSDDDTLLVGIRAADATGDWTQSTENPSQIVNHFPVPSQIVSRHNMSKRRLSISRGFQGVKPEDQSL